MQQELSRNGIVSRSVTSIGHRALATVPLLDERSRGMVDLKAIPTEINISEASALEVIDVNGENVSFGSLLEEQKAIIIFIRMSE